MLGWQLPMPNFEPLRTWSIPPGNYSNSTCEELECWKGRAQPSIEHWDSDTDFIKNYCKSTDRFEKMWMTWLRPRACCSPLRTAIDMQETRKARVFVVW